MKCRPVGWVIALVILAASVAAGVRSSEGASLAGSLTGAATPGPLMLSLATNRTNVAEGASLVIAVEVQNPGLAETVDFYFGAVLPDGDTVVFFTDLAFNVATGSLSDLATLRPIVGGVDLTTPFTFSDAEFLTYQWAGTEGAGAYTLFLAAALPGALTDPSPFIVGLSTATVDLLQPSPGKAEARLERIDRRIEFGGTTTDQILNVFYDALENTVESVKVSGGPFSMTDVPLGSQRIKDGQTFDVFNIRQVADPFPGINTIFEFEATPVGGGSPEVSQTTFMNTPSRSPISSASLPIPSRLPPRNSTRSCWSSGHSPRSTSPRCSSRASSTAPTTRSVGSGSTSL